MQGVNRGGCTANIELNAVVHALYESLNYDLLIDYRRPPDPSLSDEDAAWADALLRAQGLRPDVE